MMNLLRKHTTEEPGSPSSNTRSAANTNKRPLKIWRPRTADEMVRKRNRKVVSSHLKKIGKAAKRLDMSLDQDGVCVFTFKQFVVVVEVPEDNSSIVLFYAKVCHMSPGDNREQAQRFLDVYNHRQQGSSAEMVDASSASESTCPSLDPVGSRMRLSMNDEEVNLCLSVPIRGLTFQDTADNLEQFVKTAVAANRKLGKIKSLPTRALPPKPEEQQLPEEEPPSRRTRLWSVDSSQGSVSNMSQCSLFNLFVGNCSTNSTTQPAQQES